MQVDWAGDTLPVYDLVTGKQSPAYLFMAVLPCSCYTYAEVCEDMKTENWLSCHVHAFQYFGGVTRLLIPDNCKTATTANTRYETVLNRSYQELAEYYGTAIVPARVRKPQDKSAAEASVRFAETWIIAALRERKFFSIREMNEAIAEKLEELKQTQEFMKAVNAYYKKNGTCQGFPGLLSVKAKASRAVRKRPARALTAKGRRCFL